VASKSKQAAQSPAASPDAMIRRDGCTTRHASTPGSPGRRRAASDQGQNGIVYPVFALAEPWQVNVLVRSSYGKLYAVGQASLNTFAYVPGSDGGVQREFELWHAPAGDQLGQPQQLALAPCV
jgi:hypothetical protein